MIEPEIGMAEEPAADEARSIFQREIGATDVKTHQTLAGGRSFLKFVVGKDAPLYQYALRATQKALPTENAFRRALGLHIQKAERFPESIEATSLLTLLTRSTRAVAQDTSERGFSVPYVPFQNREDYQLAQPATHVVVGRRGVGKSTLIRRALEILKSTAAVVAVIDVQAYSTLSKDDLSREILHDVVTALAVDAARVSTLIKKNINTKTLWSIAEQLSSAQIKPNEAVVQIKRSLQDITKLTEDHVYVFLDDYHLIDSDEQPKILHLLHAALKGANGWLKVAGIRSLLNYYSARDRIGLQVPGDAQLIALDLTLENPEAAESHLRAILEGFLKAVGYSAQSDVLPEPAFKKPSR